MDDATTPAWQLRFESPYLCVLRLIGDLDGPAAHGLFAAIRTFAENQRAVLLLVDTAEIGAVDPVARKVGLEESRRVPLRGIALYNVSFGFRVVATLVHNAAVLLHGERDNPVRFFADEDEARAWIAERRAVIAAAAVA